ncbi:MAG: glycosyltransferase family 39 protein [Acidobacteriia bacterium]|nr:glycosyltransferase family 39 protein [Terriglobia bacterium]
MEMVEQRKRIAQWDNEKIVGIWRRYHLSFWVPLLAYVLFLIWINPAFEYVVGDDWIYSKSSYDLAIHHVLKIHDPSVASLLWQAVWGYLFTLPFGFSFTALHYSTIAIFVISLIFWYRTLRLYPLREIYVFAGTFMLITIPQIPVLSVSFNTDVHALAYLLIALFFYLRYLRDRRWPDLAAGAIASSLGILVRQTIILMPATLWLTLLLTHRFRTIDHDLEGADGSDVRGRAEPALRHSWLRMLFHLLPLAVLLAFYAWIKWVHGLPFVWRYQHLEIFNFNRIFSEIPADPIYTLHYAVIFILPAVVTLLISPDFYRKFFALMKSNAGRTMAAVGTVFVVGLTVFLAVARKEWMPYLQGDSYLMADQLPLPWKMVTVLTMVASIVIALSLLPALTQTLLQVQRWMLTHRPGRFLTKRPVRRSLEAIFGLLAILIAAGAMKSVLIGIGNSIVGQLYQRIGAIGGSHGYPLQFWKDQVAGLYQQFQWVGAGIILALVPLTSFLAGNMKIAAHLQRLSDVKLDEIHPPFTVRRLDDIPKTISRNRLNNLYLTIYMVLTVVYMIITGLRFDRYLIVFYPAVALLFFSQASKIVIPRGFLAGALAAFMVFSSLNARAVLAPQKVSWDIFQEMRSQDISMEQIDAGLYVSNWFNYKPERYRRISLMKYWWIDHSEYAITSEMRPGYHLLRTYPYHSPFAGEKYMYVLQRDPTDR